MAAEVARGHEMASKYDPAEVERRWYDYWEKNGLFRPDPTSTSPTFVITIPPPNITGELHMGHALTYGIEDIVGRYKRMAGFDTLILPGMDHAGIATQNVVEKQLSREGRSRHDLGRERFVERVWEWKDEYAANIRSQFASLGCAFDWSRKRFTMDAGYVDAVQEFFIRLFDEDKIYRGWRVINWCTRCHSAISDIEVEDVEREDALYYLRYPLSDGEGSITVATVRPETILGDVAVAIHPDDERYVGFADKTVILPLLNRTLKVVADEMVSREFGTGAVKITPAHDFADFEVAERHGLEMPIVIDPEGRITSVGEAYAGLGVKEAREAVLHDLEAGGYLVKTEPYSHTVPTCERCGTLLEPMLSEQWFVRMKELAAPAIEVVRDGSVTFVPERWSRVYLDWMENIRDWTISRQLWWGHRIPVYYCSEGHATAARSQPERCFVCGRPPVRQDPDVLDTWFSSALWPFATLGWPERTEDLARFYPTSFMNTSSQILYLWIARMIMTGTKFMGEVPFPTVLINPTILNHRGQRMSKSLGTGIDPRELVEEYGADALRYGLMTSGNTHQQDIRFSPDRVEQARNFANKLWNVARFILTNIPDAPEVEIRPTLPDRWIIARLNAVVAEVTLSLERYEFSGAGQVVHDFVWSEFADWYLEIAKLRLYDEDDPEGRTTAAAVLWSVLDRVVRLLHPIMPFITEEIWQLLRGSDFEAARALSGWDSDLPSSIMIAPWPSSVEGEEEATSAMETIIDIIRGVRAARSEYHVEPGKFVSAQVVGGANTKVLLENAPVIERLARLRPLTIVERGNSPTNQVVSLIVGESSVFLPLGELTDMEAERARLDKELVSARQAQQAAIARLEDERFTSRAPAPVVDRERARADELGERVRRLTERLEMLAS